MREREREREREKSEINCLLPKMVTGDLSVKEQWDQCYSSGFYGNVRTNKQHIRLLLTNQNECPYEQDICMLRHRINHCITG